MFYLGEILKEQFAKFIIYLKSKKADKAKEGFVIDYRIKALFNFFLTIVVLGAFVGLSIHFLEISFKLNVLSGILVFSLCFLVILLLAIGGERLFRTNPLEKRPFVYTASGILGGCLLFLLPTYIPFPFVAMVLVFFALSSYHLGQLMNFYEETYHEIQELRQSYSKSLDDYNKSYISVIKTLATIIEAKDPYTHGHSDRVARYSVEIAREMGLAETEIEKIKQAALFHDIGKIGIDERILRKPGILNAEEKRSIDTHPSVGAIILGSINFLAAGIPNVRHHHERYDGKGYPDGMDKENIPLGARIIAVADSYDAMTSDRTYRPKFSHNDAVAEVRKCAGTQFDPKVVLAFLRVVDTKETKKL